MNTDAITQPFLKSFPGDQSLSTQQRQTPGFLYALVNPVGFEKAKLLDFNSSHSLEIGLGEVSKSEDVEFLNANWWPKSLSPYATAYAGHQFGVWAGQLGDGRAIFAGQIQNSQGAITELQWKGAGATPYSRSADGRAVLRSTLREYLMSEALHHLGIPTTRSLSISLTGEQVWRDKLYSGQIAAEPGAVMMRTAPSFIRFGHFELLSAQGRNDLLKQLLDSLINEPKEKRDSKDDIYLNWFQQVCEKTASLVVHWYRVGFTHGVLNTDNMSALGLTIDYGPFSMLDEYSMTFTPNTTDLPGRRYAFGNQARMVQWNLWQLANAIAPIIEDQVGLQSAVDQFSQIFWTQYDAMMSSKLGWGSQLDEDSQLIDQWQELMQKLEIDYTLFFVCLEEYKETSQNIEVFEKAFYRRLSSNDRKEFEDFLQRYNERSTLDQLSTQESIQLMQQTNPKFILRNYLLLDCIEEIESGDYNLFERLKQAVQRPYERVEADLMQKRPDGYEGRFGSSMLSCSS